MINNYRNRTKIFLMYFTFEDKQSFGLELFKEYNSYLNISFGVSYILLNSNIKRKNRISFTKVIHQPEFTYMYTMHRSNIEVDIDVVNLNEDFILGLMKNGIYI